MPCRIPSFAVFLLPLALAGSTLGHGQVRWFITSTTTYPAADAYASSPDPNSPIRKLNTYGPAAPFTGADITCGVSTSPRLILLSIIVYAIARRQQRRRCCCSCCRWKYSDIRLGTMDLFVRKSSLSMTLNLTLLHRHPGKYS